MSVCDSILYFSGVLVYLNITVIIKTSISLESPPALLFIFKVILPILGPLHFYMPLETASQMPTQEKNLLAFLLCFCWIYESPGRTSIFVYSMRLSNPWLWHILPFFITIMYSRLFYREIEYFWEISLAFNILDNILNCIF